MNPQAPQLLLSFLFLVAPFCAAGKPLFAADNQFVVFDEFSLKDKPDLSKHGVVKNSRLIYATSFWAKGEDRQSLPPKQRVMDFVSTHFSDYKDVILLDIEQWTQSGTDEEVADSVNKYATIARWVREAAPEAKIGLYGTVPLTVPSWAILGPGHPKYQAWQAQNDRLAPIVDALDVMNPVLYTVSGDPDFWVETARGYVSECKRLGKGKPIYPFLAVDYHDVAAPPELRSKPMPEDFFLLQLRTLKELGADGAVIWTVKKSTPWNENAPWWLATKQFLEEVECIEISAHDLEDKIRGGMLAQLIGNLNGLPHEMDYIHEPGAVARYTPSLPAGARTDDDTDLEWVYVTEMARSEEIFLPPARITQLWMKHINRGIWCANRYSRQLMDLGIEPPLTGKIAVNPWSEFNISGQFICESFGLMAPAMPQTASRIGLHYTHVTIDGEPAQTTQLFATMIATAFVETDLNKILDAGVAAVDPRSDIATVVTTVRGYCKEDPDDWAKTRRRIKDRWQTHNGETRDRNGYELNTACAVAALLYGRGDFAETLRLAFNLGWDCDNNAATAATIVGVIKGRRWMNDQGWDIKDVYKNTTRDRMPLDETITTFENKVIACARLVIRNQGGDEVATERGKAFRIRAETPANVERLPKPLDLAPVLRAHLLLRAEKELSGSATDRARAAYVAMCLGEADRLRKDRPQEWSQAIGELQKFPNVIRDIFDAPMPSGAQLQETAARHGLKPPPKPAKVE